MNKKVLFLSGIHIIWIRRNTGWAPLFKWHDYLCLVLYLPHFALAPLRSRYSSATVFLSPIALTLTCHRPQHWLEWIFARYMREVGDSRVARLRILKNGSIKVFPALFPAGDGGGGGGYTPWSGIVFTYMHMRIVVGLPLSFAYQIHSHLRILSRGPSLFYHRFSSSLRLPHRYRENKSPRLALLSSTPITVANADNTEHHDELDPYR